MKRDHNLDFYRGIAILWIVVIHTCFNSGRSYVPDYIRHLSLIIDVPLFMFLSGLAHHYSDSFEKTIKGIVKLYLHYAIFMVIFVAYCLIFYRSSVHFKDLIPLFFFNVNSKLPLVVIGYSLWFMPMYIITSLLCSSFLEKRSLKFYHLIFTIVLYGLSKYYFSFKILPMIFLYSFIYLFGYFVYDKKLSFRNLIIFLLLLLVANLVFQFSGPYGFHNMQSAKFSYELAYLVYSFVSIITVWYLYTNFDIHNRFISYLGQNSFIVYLAQGVSSSILYFIVPYVHLWWPYKLLWMIIINTIICLVLFFILKFIYKFLDNLVNKCLIY